jgi:hypothetical protein
MIGRLLALLLIALPAVATATEPTLVARYFFAISKYTPDGTLNPKPGVEINGLPTSPSTMTMLVRAMDGSTVKTFKIEGGKIDGKSLPFFVPLAPAAEQKFSKDKLWVPAGGQYALELWTAPPPPSRLLPPRDTVTSSRSRFGFRVKVANWRFVAKDHDPMARPGTNPWPEPDPDGERDTATGDTVYR